MNAVVALRLKLVLLGGEETSRRYFGVVFVLRARSCVRVPDY